MIFLWLLLALAAVLLLFGLGAFTYNALAERNRFDP
jgi:hypothetical protein